jgi:hypothetical protein
MVRAQWLRMLESDSKHQQPGHAFSLMEEIMASAKVELRDPEGSKKRKVKWWEWLVLAAVLEVYLPRNKGQKMGLWDWVVVGAVVSSAFLQREAFDGGSRA